MELYRLLKLDQLDCSVAIIKNAASRQMGKKDIIKIDTDYRRGSWTFWATWIPASRWTSSGTDASAEKHKLTLPERLTNVIRCKNPRCISSTEQELPHVFRLTRPQDPDLPVPIL